MTIDVEKLIALAENTNNGGQDFFLARLNLAQRGADIAALLRELRLARRIVNTARDVAESQYILELLAEYDAACAKQSEGREA